MALFLVTGPTVEPVTLADAKTHLRVEVDDEDGLIDTLIVAARRHVENFTHRALLTQTWDLKLDAFPCDDFYLPYPPTASVTSITYLDTNGDSQTLDTSDYRTDLPSGPMAQRARITPGYALSYPQTYGVMNAVTVRFVAGYTDAELVPAPIVAAMKLLISHWFVQRSPVAVGNTVTTIPMAIESLLWPYVAF
jgi:uncharacterized phiE125 gp8 family phage protein